MSNIYKSVIELVGKTPLVELVNFNKNNKLGATIIAKVEGLNPAGSVKDRVAKSIIEDYEEIEIPDDVIARLKKKNENESISLERRKNSDDDFEDFLNEHSFTRKVLDKDMVAKLNSMPPEVRAMILGNMFNKFED